MWEVRGIEGAADPMESARRFMVGLSTAVQSRALLAGARAYLKTLRAGAANASPFGQFRRASDYRMASRLTKKGSVSGYLFSAPPGNVIEAGFAGHTAPLADTVDSDRGNVMAGVSRWLQQHEPALFAQFMKDRRNPPKAMRVKSRAGTPWVIPTAEAAEGSAVAAFEAAVVEFIAKEVI